MKPKDYQRAMEEGNSELLESLAINAGYTKKFDGYEEFEFEQEKLRKTTESGDPDQVLEQLDSISGKFLPKAISERIPEHMDVREQFQIPTNEEMKGISAEEKIENVNRYISRVNAFLGPLWANKEAGFVMTKEGPEPFKNSMVAFVYWVQVGNDGATRVIPESRRLFIDVFDDNPLTEMKLDWGVYTSIHNENADKHSRGEKLKPYVYGEADGTGPHAIDFESIKDDPENSGRNLPKEYADGLRVSWGTENLIYGNDAIDYLIALKEGRSSNLFPLGKDGYEELISFHENQRIGGHTLKEIEEAANLLKTKGVPDRKELEGTMEVYEKLSIEEITEGEIGPEEMSRHEDIYRRADALKVSIDIAPFLWEITRNVGNLQRLQEAYSKL